MRFGLNRTTRRDEDLVNSYRSSLFSSLRCRTDEAAQFLGEVFRERKVKKTYWSVVLGSPSQEQGDICVPLKEHAVNGRFKIALSDDETMDNVSTVHVIRTAYARVQQDVVTLVHRQQETLLPCSHQADIRMRSHPLGDDKSVASCQQA